MARDTALTVIRDEYERHPRDTAASRERALEALQSAFGASYQIDVDGLGVWWALRRDGEPGLAACCAADLADNITADLTARPPR